MSELAGLRWPEVPDPRPLVLLPVGSLEQHGPHLPLDTDTRIAVAVAAGFAAERADVVVAPALAYGASGEHAGFPGTLSLGSAVLEAALVELVRSADGTARAIVIVNGHGGNAAALRAVAELATDEGRNVLVWAPNVRVLGAAADPHAGRWETSLLTHLAPDLVRSDRAVAGPVPPVQDLVRAGVRALSPSGVLGDPAGATAAEGRELLDRLVDDLAAAVTRWERETADVRDNLTRDGT